jgi:hypothetical protein
MNATTIAISGDFIGQIETPYGVQLISRRQAQDHMEMRNAQLTSLLELLQGDGLNGFRSLPHTAQESLLWMALQMSEEIGQMMNIVIVDGDAK